MEAPDPATDGNRTLPANEVDDDIAVSAIVVNWNGEEHLRVCLDSLLRQSGVAVEIILVDNGSGDGSLDLVRETYGERVAILSFAENRGYGAALNAGIRRARGRFLFALNNDTDVAPACLSTLVDAADRYPSCGTLAPKILSFHDPEIIDNIGHLLYPDGLSRGRGRLERDAGQYDSEDEILIASGCALLLRRAMLEDVGLFDEDLFAYCEDTDLGLRAHLKGWRSRSVPAAVVYHKYSATTAAYSAEKAFLVERNRLWVAVKCLPLPMLLLSPIFTAARLAGQAWGALRGRGAAGRFAENESRTALLGILARAWSAAVGDLGTAWKKRGSVQSGRRVETLAAMRELQRHRMGVAEIAWKD